MSVVGSGSFYTFLAATALSLAALAIALRLGTGASTCAFAARTITR